MSEIQELEKNIDINTEENNEPTPIRNLNEPYMPIEFAYIDLQRSWKKCWCGRITNFRDRYCPSCGQKLGKPEYNI